MRARLMTTQPGVGSAPPLRPVPAPRATKGMLCFAQTRIDGLDLRGVAWEDDGAGEGAEVGEAVALVGLELGAIDDEICIADGCSEFGDDLRWDHNFMVSRCVRRACSGGEPAEGVGEEALLEDGVEVGAAVVEDFGLAERVVKVPAPMLRSWSRE